MTAWNHPDLRDDGYRNALDRNPAEQPKLNIRVAGLEAVEYEALAPRDPGNSLADGSAIETDHFTRICLNRESKGQVELDFLRLAGRHFDAAG